MADRHFEERDDAARRLDDGQGCLQRRQTGNNGRDGMFEILRVTGK